MALSTVDVPSDDSGQDDSEDSGSLAWANGTPLLRTSKRATGPVYDVRLLEALRRISALEHERIDANRALNDVLSRALELERRLADTRFALDHMRSQFCAFVEREIDRLTLENDGMHGRLAILQASTFWRLGVAIRSFRARLRKSR